MLAGFARDILGSPIPQLSGGRVQVVEQGDDEGIGSDELLMRELLTGKDGAPSHGDAGGRALEDVVVDRLEDAAIVFDAGRRAVPIEQGGVEEHDGEHSRAVAIVEHCRVFA